MGIAYSQPQDPGLCGTGWRCPLSFPRSRAEAVNVSAHDINQTLEYRSATAIVRLLPTGLLLVFLGLVIFALVDLDREPWTFIGIVLCWVVGGALAGFALWRRVNPGKPLFTLSPAGIHYRVPMVKGVLIPWQEIQGVDTIDIEAGYWSMRSAQFPIPRYNTWVVRDVTVILLPKPFYDRRIFVDSFLLRGPGWKANFIPKGSLVQMALHHELVSVEPRPLREAVEARWLAFPKARRDAGANERAEAGQRDGAQSEPGVPKSAAARAAPTSDIIAMGDNPKAMSRWEATKVIVLLIGIAIVLTNLIGLWQLPGQARCAKPEPRRARNRKIGRSRSGGGRRKAKSSRRSIKRCEELERGYAPHVRPIAVGVAAMAEYAVRRRKDCGDLTG